MDELIKSNFYKLACESIPYGIAAVGVDHKFIWANSHLCSILGYNVPELQKHTWMDITHDEDVGEDLSHLREVIAGQRDHYSIKKRYVKKNGEIITVLLNVQPLIMNKEILLFVSFINDAVTSEDKVIAINNRINGLEEIFNQKCREFERVTQPGYIFMLFLKEYWWLISGIVALIATIVSVFI